MVCPAHASRLAVRVAHAPATLLAVPPRAHTVCTTPFSPLTRTRKRSAELASALCAKYSPNDSVSGRPVGKAMAGDSIDVWPPSTSFAPFDAPAVSPVMRQFVDPWQLPSCKGIPALVVGSGLPRCQRPRTAEFAPPVSVQPRALSKLSWNTTLLVVDCTRINSPVPLAR